MRYHAATDARSTVPPESTPRLNRFTAVTLGLLFSGAGPLYTGRPLRGLVWVALKFMLTVAAALFLSYADARGR
jgi:TM2 domain-containing membrane protein YozV